MSVSGWEVRVEWGLGLQITLAACLKPQTVDSTTKLPQTFSETGNGLQASSGMGNKYITFYLCLQMLDVPLGVMERGQNERILQRMTGIER